MWIDKLAAERQRLHGSAGDDLIRADRLVAFAWQADPGQSASFHEQGDAFVWTAESQAKGFALFDGVSLVTPFESDPTLFGFAFSNGIGSGSDQLTWGGPWRWDPATAVLDPQWVTAGEDDRSTTLAADHAVEMRVDPIDNTLGGSRETGRWTPFVGPVAVEIQAGNGADTLLGATGDDVLAGGAGLDRIYGGDGADTLIGGDGRDIMDGQRGNDLLLGGAGNDVMSGGSGDDTLQGGEGTNILYGSAGNDLFLLGEGYTIVRGGPGQDIASYRDAPWGVQVDLLAGYGGRAGVHGDLLQGVEGVEGSAFKDTLIGSDGADVIIAGGGNDLLFGGPGNDTLSGGLGNDHLTGGTGADRFVMNAAFDGSPAAGTDVITDFRPGIDVIDLLALNHPSMWYGASLDEAFVFRGQSTLVDYPEGEVGAKPGQLRFEFRGDTTVVQLDVAHVAISTGHATSSWADGAVDAEIVLFGRHELTSADFFL
jgi:Ca2+-binding RTX toxin-like protein